VNNFQESFYQPREFIWITQYAVNLTVARSHDCLPFTAASTATAVLPRGSKIRFDWLGEWSPARGIVSGNRIARKEFLVEQSKRFKRGLFLWLISQSTRCMETLLVRKQFM